VSANFLSINRCTATGGATWNAGANSTKDANTTGWTLTTAAQELTGASVAGLSTTTANGVAKTTGITLSGNAVASIGLTQAKPINAAIKLTRYFASSVSGNVTTPANALGAPNATYTADGNTANSWTHTWRLETVAPSSNWTYYDGMPITVRFNKGTNSGNPTFSTIRALQGGSAVGTLNTASTSVTTSASGGQDHTFTIQPSWLATATAVDIEITTTAVGGGPAVRNGVQIDAATWVAQYFLTRNDPIGNSVAQTNTSTSGAITKAGTTVTGNDVKQVNTSTTGDINQTLTLFGNSVAPQPTSSTDAITQTETLSGNSVAQINTSTSDKVTKVHFLAANSVSQVNTTTSEAISQTHDLAGNSVSGSNTSTAEAIRQTHNLFSA
jgi:hypothetical protein